MEFRTGNVVSWHKQLFVVAEDKGKSLVLIPMNSSNSTSHPSLTWPSEKEGRAAVKFVANTVYGWLVKRMKKKLGIKEALSADGWSPR